MYCQFWVTRHEYCGQHAVYMSNDSRTYCALHGDIIDATLSPDAKAALRWHRLDNKPSSKEEGKNESDQRQPEPRTDWLNTGGSDPFGGGGDHGIDPDPGQYDE